MRERVIPDFVAFIDDAPHEIGISLSVLADYEERRRDLFLFEDVENGRRPTRIGTIVEREREQTGTITGTLHDIRRRKLRELFRLDVAVVDLQIARASLRSRHDLQHFTVT